MRKWSVVDDCRELTYYGSQFFEADEAATKCLCERQFDSAHKALIEASMPRGLWADERPSDAAIGEELAHLRISCRVEEPFNFRGSLHE